MTETRCTRYDRSKSVRGVEREVEFYHIPEILHVSVYHSRVREHFNQKNNTRTPTLEHRYDGLIGMNCREVMNCIPDAIVIAVQRGWSDVKKWRQGKAIVQPKYVVPYECHELRKEDRLLIITRELHEVEIHVRALGLDTQYEKIKTQASKDTIIRREKSTWRSSARVGLWRSLPPVRSKKTTHSRISLRNTELALRARTQLNTQLTLRVRTQVRSS